MSAAGRKQPTLTARERDICAAIGPELKQRGLIFTGIDVIGDYMTEINVTSPTGIQEVKRFGGADIAALIWDAIEAARIKHMITLRKSAERGTTQDRLAGFPAHIFLRRLLRSGF